MKINIILSLLSFFSFICYMFFGFNALINNFKEKINKCFFLLNLSFAIWALGFTFFYFANSIEECWIIYKFSLIGWHFFPAFLLHFFLILTKKDTKFSYLIYIPAIIFTVKGFIGIVDVISFNFDITWHLVYDSNSPWFYLSTSYYSIYIISSVFLNYFWGKKTKINSEKKQSTIILYTTLIIYFTGIIFNLILQIYKISFPMLPTVFFVLIWVFSLWHLIIKFKQKTFKFTNVSEEIISNSMDLIIIIDYDGNIVKINNKACSLLGYKEQELIGKPLNIIIIEKEMSIIQNNISQKNENNFSIKNYEVTYKTKSKEEISVIISISTIRNKQNNKIGYILIGKDTSILNQLLEEIKEKRKLETNLLESEELYKILVDFLPDAVIIHREGKFKFLNPAGVKLLGAKSIDQLIGTPIINVVHPDYQNIVLTRIKTMENKGDVPVIEEKFIKFDGTVIDVEVSPIPINYYGQQSILAIVRDISERKKVEEQVRKLYHAVEQSASVIVITNFEKIIEYVNPKFLNITGFTKEEIIGKNVNIIKSGTHTQSFYQELNDILESGREWSGEFHNKKKNGELYWENALISPIKNLKNEIINFIKVGEDITEQKILKEELAKASKLESLSVLAGGIAHDFNNILTAIVGNISIAKILIENNDTVSSILDEAEKASLRAKNLTAQLLTFSKGGIPIKETKSIINLIKESTNFILRGSNIICNFDFQEDLWNVEIDEGQINQVINNLVLNAKESMSDGGEISVSCKNILFDKENQNPQLKNGKYVVVVIKDNGIGIPKEIIDKIFDPYFTTKEKGNGLGLASTYSIIKKHDGYIFVDSVLKVGSTFSIFLPATVNEINEIQSEKKITKLKISKKILIMDDEQIVLTFLKNALTFYNFIVETATDGQIAISKYKSALEDGSPFDLVILDLTVPTGMGGKETIKKLLEIDPDVKSIISSGYSNDSISSLMEEYNFKGYITKPFKIEVLIKLLNKLVP